MAGPRLRRHRIARSHVSRGGLVAGVLTLALALSGASFQQSFEEIWQTLFRGACADYQSSEPAQQRAGELELIRNAPALLATLESQPTISAKHADYAVRTYLRILASATGDARTAVVEIGLGSRVDRFAHAWGESSIGWECAYWVGYDLMSRGLLGDADDVFHRALDSYATPTLMTLNVHLMRAEIRRVDGRWEEARACLKDADELLADLGLAPGSVEVLKHEARSFGILGQLELKRGLPDIAATAFEKERALAETLAAPPHDDPFELGNATLHRMDLYLLLERYERILAEAPAVLDLDIGPDARVAIEFQIALALAALELREPERERTAGGRLDAQLQSGRLGELRELQALIVLAELAMSEGRLDDARARLERGSAQLAALGTDSQLVFELAWQRALEARLERLAHASPEVLEQRLDALLVAYDALLDTWAAQPLPPGGLGFLQSARQRIVVGEAVALCLLVPGRGPEAAVEQALRAQANGTLSRRVGAKAPTLTELRETLLSDGGGLLIYQQTGFESHLLAIDAHGVLYAELPPIHAIDALKFELLDLVHRDPGHSTGANAQQRKLDLADVEAFAKALGDELLPTSVRARINGWSHVIISDGSQLGDVPWAALPLADGEPLGLSKPFCELPSVPFGMYLARRGRPRDPSFDLLLFAMPSPGADALAIQPRLSPLPLDGTTERRLGGAFPAERVRAWLGLDASRAALLNAPLERAAILHLFCHGLSDASRERPAVLVLAASGETGGLLDCDAVEALAGRVPPLVILSACEAAKGHARTGEDGTTHLGGAFQFAGADAVVLTSASVEYAATIALMEVFERELAAGRDVGRAMLAARRAVARSQPHPYYHSLFRVVGLGTTRPLPERR